MWVTYLGSWMTTCLGKSCSFSLPWVPFINCCQFMCLVISLLVLRAGSDCISSWSLLIFLLFILQTRMRSHPLGLDVWFLVGPFVYIHISCVRTAKALVRLHGCTGSPEPSLVTYVITSWAGSFEFSWKWTEILCETNCFVSLSVDHLHRGFENFNGEMNKSKRR